MVVHRAVTTMALLVAATALPAGAAAALSPTELPVHDNARAHASTLHRAAAHSAAARPAAAHGSGATLTVEVPPLLVSRIVRADGVVRVAGLASAGSPAGRLELRAGAQSCRVDLVPGVPGRCVLPAVPGPVTAVAVSPGHRVAARG